MVLIVSTIKFDLQDQLNEIQARIYLEKKIKLSKKEILEIIFTIGLEQYEEILKRVENQQQKIDSSLIEGILSLSEDFGEGSENLSNEIDDIIYRKIIRDEQDEHFS